MNHKEVHTTTKDRNLAYPDRISMVMFFLKGCKRYFVLAILFAALVSLFDLVNPKIIQFTVDAVIGNSMPSMPSPLQPLLTRSGGIPYLRSHLYIVAVLVVGVAAAGGICRYLFSLMNAKGAETLVKRMRDSLFEHIIHLPFSWYSENHTGDIIQRCTSDVETIKTFLSEQLVSLFRTLGTHKEQPTIPHVPLHVVLHFGINHGRIILQCVIAHYTSDCLRLLRPFQCKAILSRHKEGLLDRVG